MPTTTTIVPESSTETPTKESIEISATTPSTSAFNKSQETKSNYSAETTIHPLQNFETTTLAAEPTLEVRNETMFMELETLPECTTVTTDEIGAASTTTDHATTLTLTEVSDPVVTSTTLASNQIVTSTTLTSDQGVPSTLASDHGLPSTTLRSEPVVTSATLTLEQGVTSTTLTDVEMAAETEASSTHEEQVTSPPRMSSTDFAPFLFPTSSEGLDVVDEATPISSPPAEVKSSVRILFPDEDYSQWTVSDDDIIRFID